MSKELNQEMSELVKRYLPGAMAGEMLTFLKEADSLKIELKQTKEELEKAKDELEELREFKSKSIDLDVKTKEYEGYKKKIDKMEENLQDRLRQYNLDVQNLELKAKYEAGLEAQKSVNEIITNVFQNLNVEVKKK